MDEKEVLGRITDKSDHDLIIELKVLLGIVLKTQDNHLRHHWAITVLALSIGLIGIVNLGIGLILVLAKGI